MEIVRRAIASISSEIANLVGCVYEM